MSADFGIDSEIAAAFLKACEDELLSLKPGNVHVYADGHRMTAGDFRKSARVAAPLIARSGVPVGARIKSAVQASMEAIGQNTNLGIILLCAPLAHAASLETKAALRDRLCETLASLSANDATLTFEAIALANPGGLGEHQAADVRKAPLIGLLEAMRLASSFDRIARAYVTNFEDVFDFGLSHLRDARRDLSDFHLAVTALFLAFLAAFPDSHIQRKFGAETARAVSGEAAEVRKAFWHASGTARTNLLLGFDARLKGRGLNPGTSADFTVATLFAEALARLAP